MKELISTKKLVIALIAFFFMPLANAQEAATEDPDGIIVNQADSLEQLLQLVDERRVTESREHARRTLNNLLEASPV